MNELYAFWNVSLAVLLAIIYVSFFIYRKAIWRAMKKGVWRVFNK